MDNDHEVWAVYLFTYDSGACCASPELWKTWVVSSKSMAQTACAKIYKAVQHEQNTGCRYDFSSIKYERLASPINSLSVIETDAFGKPTPSEGLVWVRNHYDAETEKIDLVIRRDSGSCLRKRMADQLRRWRNVEGDWSRKRMAQAVPV